MRELITKNKTAMPMLAQHMRKGPRVTLVPMELVTHGSDGMFDIPEEWRAKVELMSRTCLVCNKITDIEMGVVVGTPECSEFGGHEVRAIAHCCEQCKGKGEFANRVLDYLNDHPEIGDPTHNAETLPQQPVRVEPPDGMHTSRRHSHWEDVVDLQDDMIRFWFSRFGVAYGEAWGGSMIKAATEDFTEQDPDWKPGGMQWALNLGLIERAKLQMADPIWISPDVQKVIIAAAASWEPEKLLVEDVFPHLYGFAVFPEPFIVIDMYGKRLSFRAISWAPIRHDGAVPYEAGLRAHPSEASGVIISAYTHRDDFDDYPIMEKLEQQKDDLKIPITQLPAMSLCYVTPWRFNREHGPVDMTGSGLSDFCKILQVTWRLARQTLTSPSSARLPRAQRKRAEKARLHSDVVVVRLRQARHPKKDDAEPKKVEYSHRWVVGAGTGGFWRNQWYPKLKEHRQIWIAPYIKGPEDKELIIKPLRAYEFVR